MWAAQNIFLVFCLTYGIFMNIIENDVLISM